MSGYLEVKYPFKSNLGFNPFKSWKRQWCILRPSPTSSGCSLAVYCSEAGAAAGAVDFPAGCVVRRAKSRSRPYAFAVFGTEDRKPRVLLAAQTQHDANSWMDKIRTLLCEDQSLGSDSLLKDCYSVSVEPSEVSRRCGVQGDGVVSLGLRGLRLQPRALRPAALVPWAAVAGVDTDKRQTCVLTIDSSYQYGGGELKLWCGTAGELAKAIEQARCSALKGQTEGEDADDSSVLRAHNFSRSDGDLHSNSNSDLGEIRRSSWYSGPSEVSLDDLDLIMSKEAKRIPSGQLSRCSGAGDLAPRTPTAATATATASAPAPAPATPQLKALQASRDDSMSDRRSLASVASGIYEEIPDLPTPSATSPTEAEAVYCSMVRSGSATALRKIHENSQEISKASRKICENSQEICEDSQQICDVSRKICDDSRRICDDSREIRDSLAIHAGDEPTYESVADCVYATMRRSGKRFPPPPLPPRTPFGTLKAGDSWNSRMNSSPGSVTRHGSLGSLGALPRCCSLSSSDSTSSAATLPAKARHTPFSVFRKRLKSDSRVMTSPKSDLSKENKDVETKKKKFDFTPTREMFKNFKMGRKGKTKAGCGVLAKGGTKSCEFLDASGGEVGEENPRAKSVECLDDNEEEVSVELSDDVSALALPQEIVALIVRARAPRRPPSPISPPIEIPLTPLSPIPTPLEHHYIVMSPRAKLA